MAAAKKINKPKSALLRSAKKGKDRLLAGLGDEKTGLWAGGSGMFKVP